MAMSVSSEMTFFSMKMQSAICPQLRTTRIVVNPFFMGRFLARSIILRTQNIFSKPWVMFVFEYVRKGAKNQIVTAGHLLAVLDMRPSTTIRGSLIYYGSFNNYTIIGTILDPKLLKRFNNHRVRRH